MAEHNVNGGLARAAALSPEARSEIASTTAKARWRGDAKPSSLKVAIRQIEKHKVAIGRHRDALREILDDLTGVVDSTDAAYESLDYAIDQLSQLL